MGYKVKRNISEFTGKRKQKLFDAAANCYFVLFNDFLFKLFHLISEQNVELSSETKAVNIKTIMHLQTH